MDDRTTCALRVVLNHSEPDVLLRENRRLRKLMDEMQFRLHYAEAGRGGLEAISIQPKAEDPNWCCYCGDTTTQDTATRWLAETDCICAGCHNGDKTAGFGCVCSGVSCHDLGCRIMTATFWVCQCCVLKNYRNRVKEFARRGAFYNGSTYRFTSHPMGDVRSAVAED